MKIFWSWQSDTPSKNNHRLIHDALELAIEKVASDLSLTEAERPEVDHDTKGEPGLVSIVDKIFEKISQAAVFVGDLTFVGQTPAGKMLPNPNVMIELGHAITSLGPEHIILVSNQAYGGKPEDLPFDLRHRRAPISYNLPETASNEDRKKAKQELAKLLAPALLGCLGRSLDAAAKDIVYPVVPARADDRSTWLASNELIQHHNFFNEGGVTSWKVTDAPRFYVRVIPATFDAKITSREVHELRQPNNLNVLHPWRGGDGGVNVHGVVAVGVRDDEAFAVTQWFRKTSEVWAFNNNAVFVDPAGAQKLVPWRAIAKSWHEHLDRTCNFLAQLGVSGPMQIEAGVVGLDDALWEEASGVRHRTFLNEVFLQRAEPKWDPIKQREFLTEAFNLLRDAYNHPLISVDDFLRIVGSN